MEQIINSILDDDLYKFSMQQAVIHHFPYAKVEYKFINRGGTKFPEGFSRELKRQIKVMETVFLNSAEKRYLRSIYFLSPFYIDFLGGYKFDSKEIEIFQDASGNLDLTITGYWYRTILWEVPLMAIISELYFRMTGEPIKDLFAIYEKNKEKGKIFLNNNIKVAEFGTRRRYSYSIQKQVIEDLKNTCPNNLVGTSNLDLARQYKIKAIGTHAHEWFMFHAAKYGYKMANRLAMEHWVDVYRGDLGIALSDTFTTDVFLRSFDKKFAKLYDGVRQDSGDPFSFTDKIIKHYNTLGIDPMSKTIVFSDSLNPEKAKELNDYCKDKIKCSFGIGTNLTNDVGVKPLNMVIKLSKVKPEGEDWINVVKLSDEPGKHTGEKIEIENCKFILGITNKT
jgi:nicotinate phosphoribosyltransferase